MADSHGWSSVPNWVIRSDKLHGSEKLLYIALLNRSNSKGECWPSLATLEKEVGVSRNTILKKLRALESKGLIRRVKRKGSDGRDLSNVYKVLPFREGSKNEPMGSNEHHGGVQPVNTGGSNEHHEVLPIEVLPNRSTTHIPFEHVWSTWPKKTEKDRAEKEYLKHVKTVPELPALIAQFGQAYEQTTSKRYIPSLAAWLHRKRWTDELPESDKSQPLSKAAQNAAEFRRIFGNEGSVPAIDTGVGS